MASKTKAAGQCSAKTSLTALNAASPNLAAGGVDTSGPYGGWASVAVEGPYGGW